MQFFLPRNVLTSLAVFSHIHSVIYWNIRSFMQKWLNYTFMLHAAKSPQLCPTLCHPIASSPPGSPVPGILQARTLEWVAISFSNAGKWKVKVKSLSRVRLFGTPWTAAHQAPLSMGFSRQEYWSGVPLPSPLCYIPKANLSHFKFFKWMFSCIIILLILVKIHYGWI